MDEHVIHIATLSDRLHDVAVGNISATILLYGSVISIILLIAVRPLFKRGAR